MNNLNILIDSATNTAKAPAVLNSGAPNPLKTISAASLANLVSYAQGKLSRPEVIEAASASAGDLCRISCDIAHLQAAIERAENSIVREDTSCVRQSVVGHSLLLLIEQLEVKMSSICAIRCIKLIDYILSEKDMVKLQNAVTESAKPFQSLILEIKPLIEIFKEKDPNNIFSTELGDCMRALSESIVIFFTAVQSMITRGGVPTPTRSDRRAGDGVIRVLDRVIVTCSAVYSVNMRLIKSVDNVTGSSYACTLRAPLEERLVDKIIDLRLRLDSTYQSILAWSNLTDPDQSSLDKSSENVRSMVEDINLALNMARKIAVYDEAPVKKLLTESACKDIGDYILKMLSELRVIAKETPQTKEARNAAVSRKFRLFYVMTRQSIDILYAAVALSGTASTAALGCYAKLVNTVMTDLAKLTEAQQVSTELVKEALINCEMCFSKYILILEGLTSSDTSSHQLGAMTSSAHAIRAAIDILKSQKVALSTAAKKALATQQGAPQGSLTKVLCGDVTEYIDVITPIANRVLSYQVAFERDAEYLFSYLKNNGPTGIRTLYPQLLTEYVRSLLLTLQGLQSDIKKYVAEFPARSAAEDKCRSFAPHMQTLVALARSTSISPSDITAARASVASISRDITQVAAAVAGDTFSDVKMPAPLNTAFKEWYESVKAENARMSFAAVPSNMIFNPTVAGLAHSIEESINALPGAGERCGQGGKQLVAIAKELAKGVVLMSLEGTGPDVIMTAAEAIVVTCRSIIKITGIVAEKFRRKYKFGYTGLMIMNVNCIMNVNGFRVCAPGYALNKKEFKYRMENVLKELILNVIDIVSAVATYEI